MFYILKFTRYTFTFLSVINKRHVDCTRTPPGHEQVILCRIVEIMLRNKHI